VSIFKTKTEQKQNKITIKTSLKNKTQQIKTESSVDEMSVEIISFFECVAKAVQQCEDIAYRPTILVADAASSITKGFRRAFNYSEGEFTRVVCWQDRKRLGLMQDQHKVIQIGQSISLVKTR